MCKKDTPLTQASADQDGFCVEPTPEYVSAYRHMYALPESHTLKHQDLIPIQGTGKTFTDWFPLHDLPPEIDGLEVAAGSH